MKVKQIVFRPLIENGKPAVRRPRDAEWFMFPDGSAVQCHTEFSSDYPILTRHEEEYEIPDPPKVYGWVKKATEVCRSPLGPFGPSLTHTISAHAAEVSPERLCELISTYSATYGASWGDILSEAQRIREAWKTE